MKVWFGHWMPANVHSMCLLLLSSCFVVAWYHYPALVSAWRPFWWFWLLCRTDSKMDDARLPYP